MRRSGFEGWYFKHQNGGDTVALIPGTADSGAFIQVITADAARQISLPALWKDRTGIHAEGVHFTRHGCDISLPGVQGHVEYGRFQPLKRSIMGPFRFFPMECTHEVISMAHSLRGSLTVDGRCHDLTGGVGYIEKDSGVSFPGAYQWVQCGSFSEPCAVMAAIARIPFGCVRFRGCICALIFHGREYRFATYNGVRILAADANHICLAQGRRLLEIDMEPQHRGHALLAPINGRMTARIRESSHASLRLRMWEGGQLVCDLHSEYAAYEYVPQLQAADNL